MVIGTPASNSLPYRMGIERCDGSGTDVAGDADFERDLIVAETAHQSRVVGGTNAVPDAIGPEFDATPDGGRSVNLSGVRDERHPVLLRESEHVAKPLRRAADFIAPDSKRHDAVVLAFDGEFGDAHCRFVAEMADGVEHPSDLEWSAGCLASQCIEDGVEVLFLPQNYSDRNGDLGIDDILRRKLFETPPSGECVMFGCTQLTIDPLVGFEESRKVMETESLSYFADVQRRVYLDKSLRFYRAFEMQMQFGQHYLP